jgi:3-phenylpropionate/trans-cinnamate dioxygenase ferredoxin reductase subunit
MSQTHVKYLLIGGGVASHAAAAAIRQRDPVGAVMLVGQEISRPYHRAPLSKGFLRRELTRSALFTCGPEWYAQNFIQLHTGCRAAHLDTGRAVVAMDNGDSVSYDRLLLATGSVPRPLGLPGDTLPNVFYLRTIEDVEQIHKAIDKAKHEGRRHLNAQGDKQGGRGKAVVIGGGLMGVEIASSLTQIGLAVDLLVAASFPWNHVAGEPTGKFIAGFLATHGISVHLSSRADRIEGDGRAQRVRLADGQTVECDFLVSAVGTTQNKDLLRGTGIVAEKAILADQHCRTNEPDIFAAGDCAAVHDAIFGKHRPADQWDTAASTGAIAGASMARAAASLQTVASFETEFFGVKARAWGHSKHVDRRLLRGSPNPETPDFAEIGLDSQGRISFALAVGHTAEHAVLEELVRRRFPIDGNEEALRDPTTDLQNLLR